MQVLLRRALDVASEHDLPTVLQRIVEAAAEVAGARYSAIAVYDADGVISSFVHCGMDDETVARIGQRPQGIGLFQHDVLDTRPGQLVRPAARS